MTDQEAVLEILAALERSESEVSIAGGWAVDALLGRVTRDHSDLDLAIDAMAVDAAIAALRDLGVRVSVDQRPARVELTDGDRKVDLHPVVWSADGTGRQPGLAGETYEYPAGSTAAMGTIGGRLVRCLAPDLLLRFRDGYDPRPVDRQDVAALATRFRLPLPPAYRVDVDP